MPAKEETDGNHLHLPTITLDKTLSDLYRQHCPSLAQTRIGHIFCGATSTADLSPSFPRNRKYIYQDSAFNDAARAQKSDEEVQRSLAPKYLSLVPQRDAFIAGPGPVIFFHSGSSHEDIEHDKAEAKRTLAALDETQRPETIFCSSPRDVGTLTAEKGIGKLSMKIVVDAVVSSLVEPNAAQLLTEPDTLYFLNSKAALATSGLPTPATQIISVPGHLPPPSSCCEICSTSSSDQDVPQSCSGPRSRWLGEQTLRILSAISRQKLPFVFKNQQAFAGAGTYVITTGPERNTLVKELTSGEILRRMLCTINAENAHLAPGSILLMSKVDDPVADYGLTFFVGEDGAPQFLAASEQMIDRASASWLGSKISYSHQNSLERKFSPLITQISAFLHKHAYVGPAGADILETRAGEHMIVDLNVRTSGSLCLPLMRTHFNSRGLMFATSLSITVRESREDFCALWLEEMREGSMCIVAWFEDVRAGCSFGDVVFGAEDEEGLARVLERVREGSEKVTF